QTRSVPSLPTEARDIPIGAQLSRVTAPVCPVSSPSGLRVATSQSRTLLSLPPEARSLLSWEKATAWTGPWCPSRPVGSGVPTAHSRTVIWALLRLPPARYLLSGDHTRSSGPGLPLSSPVRRKSLPSKRTLAPVLLRTSR